MAFVLNDIMIKVRRLVRAPSTNQLSDAALINYINAFLLISMPENLRMFNYRKNLQFFTIPNIEVYSSNNIAGDPLNDFVDQITGVYDPVYIGGQKCTLTQYQSQFYNIAAFSTNINTNIGGNGTPGPFTGVIATFPILQTSVSFACLQDETTMMTIHDFPQNREIGWFGIGTIVPTGPNPIDNGYGTINYLTGEWTIVFPNNTMVGAFINANYSPYAPGRPTTVLYFNNQFFIRPVPDNVYPVSIEVDILPTAFLNTMPYTQAPDMQLFWQYIAYGTAIDIFYDRMSDEDVARLMPRFEEMQDIVYRRTIAQYANRPHPTIFSDGGNGNNFGNTPFGIW